MTPTQPPTKLVLSQDTPLEPNIAYGIVQSVVREAEPVSVSDLPQSEEPQDYEKPVPSHTTTYA